MEMPCGLMPHGIFVSCATFFSGLLFLCDNARIRFIYVIYSICFADPVFSR